MYHMHEGTSHSMLARLALLLILLAMSAVCIATTAVAPPSGDGYEHYALSLSKWGSYGIITGDSGSPPPPAMGRAPVYPIFQAAMMRLNNADFAWGECYQQLGLQCELRPQLLPLVQLALAVLVVFLIFEMSLILGARAPIALLVTVAAAPPYLFLVYEHQVSEAIAMPLFGLISYCLMLWFVQGAGVRVLLVAGIALGLLALTRIAYVYALPCVAVAIFFLPKAQNTIRPRRRALAAAGFSLCFLVVVVPWYVRNAIVFGQVSIGESGAAGALAQRVSYNRMTFREGLAGIVYFMPGYGDQLATVLFPPDVWSKYDFNNPQGFRQTGRALLQRQATLHPDPGDLRRFLLGEMFRSPVRHALVSIPLSIDGVRYVFLFLPLAVLGFVVSNCRRALLGALSLALYTFLFHAAVTHFRARYGLPLLFAAVPLAAFGLDYIYRRFQTARSSTGFKGNSADAVATQRVSCHGPS